MAVYVPLSACSKFYTVKPAYTDSIKRKMLHWRSCITRQALAEQPWQGLTQYTPTVVQGNDAQACCVCVCVCVCK